MRFEYQTEQEMKELTFLPDGAYQFEVMEYHDANRNGELYQDAEGNDMCKIKIKLWDKNGKERFIFTNLFARGRMAFKTRHFVDSIGKISSWEDKTFQMKDALGEMGWCLIITRKGGLKKDGSGEKWDDQNDVKDYIKLADQEKFKNAAKANESFLDDDIPNFA